MGFRYNTRQQNAIAHIANWLYRNKIRLWSRDRHSITDDQWSDYCNYVGAIWSCSNCILLMNMSYNSKLFFEPVRFTKDLYRLICQMLKKCVMMTSSKGNIFCVTGHLYGEFTGHRWIALKKASNAELWCLLWSALKQRIAQTIETPVIWDAIALIMTSL